MFELIRANQRRSVILFVLMGMVLLALGYLIGQSYAPPDGGVYGFFVALGVWLFMTLLSITSGDRIILATSGAKEVTRDVHPQLFNVVEEMRIASNLPAMPRIYIIPDETPNAFAAGIKPENSAVAVTAGLLAELNRDELQGVIAHEISHIMNRDVQFLTFAGILLGSIVLISHTFFRSMIYGGSRRYRSNSSSKGGQGQAIILVITVLLAILAPIIARLLYFAISRKREYLADASAARLTRYPEGLASALEKISGKARPMKSANDVTAPMYISNPLKNSTALGGMTSTHPPIDKRIQILRNMSQGVSYRNYQSAFTTVMGDKAPVIPVSGMNDTDVQPIRKAKPGAKPPASNKKRDMADIIRAVDQFAFLSCVCGLKLKIPPDYNKSTVSCPRCSKSLDVPMVELAAAAQAIRQSEQKKDHGSEPEKTQVYQRKGSGWETFNCNCGGRIQLSPIFSGDHIICHACGKSITVN